MNRRVQARMYRTSMLGAGWIVSVSTPSQRLSESAVAEPIPDRDIERGVSTINRVDLLIEPNAASARALTRAASAVRAHEHMRHRMVYSYLNLPTREYL